MIKFFNTLMGRIIISIIWGLGLSCLFRKVCKDRECLVFHAADYKKIKNQVFDFDGKCYEFNEKAERCNKNKKILDFA